MCILIAEQLEQLSTLLSEILCPESLSLTYASTQATLGLDFLALRAKDVTQGDVHLCAPVDAKLIDTWAHRSSISPGGYRSSMAAPDCLQTGVRTPGHTRAHLAHLGPDHLVQWNYPGGISMALLLQGSLSHTVAWN